MTLTPSGRVQAMLPPERLRFRSTRRDGLGKEQIASHLTFIEAVFTNACKILTRSQRDRDGILYP